MFQRVAFRLSLHASEQYLTSSQTFAHFFRQENGRLQVRHILVGKLSFLCGILNHTVPKNTDLNTTQRLINGGHPRDAVSENTAPCSPCP